MTDPNAAAAVALAALRERRVLVHSITNYVVMNTTANVLLAAGASPVMAHAREEVEEMAALAGAVVLNIGTLSPVWVEAMRLAGAAANRQGVPVVLDPVGSGATAYRTSTARSLARELKIAVIRGNASEILSVAGLATATRGVDAAHDVAEAARVGAELARRLGSTVAITGEVDLVTDGARVVEVRPRLDVTPYLRDRVVADPRETALLGNLACVVPAGDGSGRLIPAQPEPFHVVELCCGEGLLAIL